MIPSHWQTFRGCQSLLEFFDDLPDLKGERAVYRAAGTYRDVGSGPHHFLADTLYPIIIGESGNREKKTHYIGFSPPRVLLFWRSLVLEARKGGAQSRLTLEFRIWVVFMNFQVHIF